MPKRRLPPGVLDEEDLRDIEDEDYDVLKELVEKEMGEDAGGKSKGRKSP
jgi:hypothetical protein